ncbi:MAG TPA: nickel pincer cofactor biosynthesis protein LarB [Bacteroidota bacterium]
MNEERLRKLLRDVRDGSVSLDQAVRSLQGGMTEDLGFAHVDHHRELRQGFPEVILCEGKSPGQVAAIARRILRQGSPLLATRAGREHFAAVKRAVKEARFHRRARLITAGERAVTPRGEGTILVVTGGTSDLPVAEEAAVTARMMGNDVEELIDVGVAGIHRILGNGELLRNAAVVIVVAGMEGALASVVGGLVRVPVIAVPTSIGYGASFGGLAALLGMLNSCAAGVTVVNIDNGFGAAVAASLINRRKQ